MSEARYQQIATLIEEDIKLNFYVGDLYYSENMLVEKYEVNRHTIRRALSQLAQQGLVEKRQGAGCFVSDKRVNYAINANQRLSQALAHLDVAISTELLDAELVVVKNVIAEALELPGENVQAIRIKTLRKLNDEVIATITHYFPLEVCPCLLTAYESGSLGEFLSNNCAIHTRRVSSTISAVIASNLDNIYLENNHQRPVLKVETLSKDQSTGKPVEYSVTRFRSDKIALKLLLSD